MPIAFNADEVLGMAEQIERNGTSFYRKGASIVKDEETKKLLDDLARWEETHEKLFKAMRAELTDEERAATAADPDGEAELYIQAMADTHVFNVKKDPLKLLAGKKKPLDVLAAALEFEKDSILFFMGLSRAVPARLGKDRVDKIVQEEFRHVAFINRRMGALKKA